MKRSSGFIVPTAKKPFIAPSLVRPSSAPTVAAPPAPAAADANSSAPAAATESPEALPVEKENPPTEADEQCTKPAAAFTPSTADAESAPTTTTSIGHPQVPLRPTGFKPPMRVGFVPPDVVRRVVKAQTGGVGGEGGSKGGGPGDVAATGAADGGDTSTRRFEAQYCKNINKKRKTYNEGVVTVVKEAQSVKLTLESEAGKVEARKTLYGAHEVSQGSSFVIGGFQVEVGTLKPARGAAADGGDLMGGIGDCGSGASGGPAPPRPLLSAAATARFAIGKPATTAGGGAMVAVRGGGVRKPVGGSGGGASAAAGGAASSGSGSVDVSAREGVRPGEIVIHEPVGPCECRVVIEAFLARVLRPHQVTAVRFLWRCLTGRGALRESGRGAILADDMGLGKTLTTISLIYTMTKQGPSGRPDVLKAVVVCPSSLVAQWGQEFKKWLNIRIRFSMVDGALGKMLGKGGSSDQIKTFISSSAAHSTVLILSYECYRGNAHLINSCEDIGLLVCDEGHRLKASDGSKTMAALGGAAKTRLILTGTPVQNDLEEFHALCSFVNPGLLGTAESFRKTYAKPIARGRDKKASVTAQEFGYQRNKELVDICSRFVIRRAAQEVLTTLIPPKTDLVVFCRLTADQRRLYEACVKASRSLGLIDDDEDRKSGLGLKLCDMLRKLANHPRLLFPDGDLASIEDERVLSALTTTKASAAEADELREHATGSKKGPASDYDSKDSGKLGVLEQLLSMIHRTTTDRAVISSSFTSTLDVIETLTKRHRWKTLRLDGHVVQGARQGLVDHFNKQPACPERRSDDEPFIFLLSSRAGGMGLNLVGGNRLVLFDSDWNPAIDSQCKSRVYRDGQTKPCVIYRLLSTGSIDEKLYQRQLSKKELHATLMEDSQHQVRNFSAQDLRRLFELSPPHVKCDTFLTLRQSSAQRWKDYKGPASISDMPLRQAVLAQGQAAAVSFVHEEGAEGLDEEDGGVKGGIGSGDNVCLEEAGGGIKGGEALPLEDDDEEEDEVVVVKGRRTVIKQEGRKREAVACAGNGAGHGADDSCGESEWDEAGDQKSRPQEGHADGCGGGAAEHASDLGLFNDDDEMWGF